MFVKKVQAVIWTSPYDMDARRDFKATYVFDDGYESLDECTSKIKELGYDPKLFVFVKFCEQFYAVNICSYYSYVVISRKSLIYNKDHRDKEMTIVPLGTSPADRGDLPEIKMLAQHNFWTPGIQQDLQLIDPNVSMTWNGMPVDDRTILFNNILITLGREFFITEICIKTDNYVEHVFRNYYNENSMALKRREIEKCRRDGYQYYNPFTGSKSRDYTEARAKYILNHNRLKPVTKKEVIMIPDIPTETVIMPPTRKRRTKRKL